MPISTARRGALALLLAALVLFVLGSIELARAATHSVAISGFAFAPATLTITAGDTVTWTNEDSVTHTATSTTGAFDSGPLAQGASFSFTFTTPGTYDYLCTPHPSMTGQIVVEAAPAAPPAPSATPATGNGEIPDVAVPLGRSASPIVIGAILLGGAVGLTVIARRQRI